MPYPPIIVCKQLFCWIAVSKMRLNISLFLVTVWWMALLEPRRDMSTFIGHQ